MAEIPEDADIRALLRRLARPRPAGGLVVERAALLAAGSDFDAIEAWLRKHGAVAEEVAPPASRPGSVGLYAERHAAAATAVPAARYVLPADALA